MIDGHDLSDYEWAVLELLLPAAARSCPTRWALPNYKNADADHDREALGRSRGGLTTKVHLARTAAAVWLPGVVTAGQRNDAVVFDAVMDRVHVLRRERGRPHGLRVRADHRFRSQGGRARLAVAAALSLWTETYLWRNATSYRRAYVDGVPTGPLETIGRTVRVLFHGQGHVARMRLPLSTRFPRPDRGGGRRLLSDRARPAIRDLPDRYADANARAKSAHTNDAAHPSNPRRPEP